MTKLEFLQNVIDYTNHEPTREYAEAEILRVRAHNEKTRKHNVPIDFNHELKRKILQQLANSNGYTGKELATIFEVTPQRISILCKQLSTDRLIRVETYSPNGKPPFVNKYYPISQ